MQIRPRSDRSAPLRSFRILRFSQAVFSLAVAAVVFVLAQAARADERSIIRNAGDHPHYGVEIEPHLTLGVGGPVSSDGFGLGGRFSIPIVDNGFVPTINNNVAIGLGVDWVHWSGCRYFVNAFVYTSGCSVNSFIFPLVMQWNFFLSTHFSVFGEPGLAFEYVSWSGLDTCVRAANGTAVCGDTPSATSVTPVIYIGGRYHFSESVALTLRIGWPTFSLGFSFF